MQKRPDELKGSTRLMKTGCGNLYTTLNKDEKEERLFEVFLSLGKAGGCAACQNEAIGRLLSLAFRSGASEGDAIRTLKGIHCHLSNNDEEIYSCAHAVAVAMEKYLGLEGLKPFDEED